MYLYVICSQKHNDLQSTKMTQHFNASIKVSGEKISTKNVHG